MVLPTGGYVGGDHVVTDAISWPPAQGLTHKDTY